MEYLGYIGKLILLTLGTIVICGFAVRLCARLFSKLSGCGSDAVFDVTAVIGTPVHELGHAMMCLLFAHKITGICLWSPSAKNGMYGYVEHSYHRKNVWAILGNLFIGVGPIFSGLSVVVLMLWLCFPTQWSDYLALSRTISMESAGLPDILKGIFSLFVSLPAAFGEAPLLAILGLLVILSVSLHISLSWADIRGSASALPIYLLLVAVFGIVTLLLKLDDPIVAFLQLLNLRVLSLFALVIAFAAVWVVIALLIRLIRWIVSFF